MALAEQLVQGVDVWISTPRRPWEASGTSGMKVLVNGGLNLSELDGWWAEAWSPEGGWALGDGQEHLEPEWDAVETDQLYDLLEKQVVPEFYERDAEGVPRAWVARIRASLARLTPRFSSNRMLAQYLDSLYLPAATTYWERTDHGLQPARALSQWYRDLYHHWHTIHWGNLDVQAGAEVHAFRVQVYLGDIAPGTVDVQLYAASGSGGNADVRSMRKDHPLSGAAGGFLYVADVPARRPAADYTPRVVPANPLARVPTEANFIRWYPD
jgi:starch phosphorylase